MIDSQKINDHFKTTISIFLALIAGQIVLLVLALWFVKSPEFIPDLEFDSVLKILTPFVGIVMMFLSRAIYKKQIVKVSDSEDLQIKLNYYRTFKIISFALLEAAGLLALVSFIITANYLYILVFVFLMGFLYMIRPSREGFVVDFKISDDEAESILRRKV